MKEYNNKRTDEVAAMSMEERDNLFFQATCDFYGGHKLDRIGGRLRSPADAAEKLVALAKNNYWRAYVLLSHMYSLGAGVKKDNKIAFALMQIAANHNAPDAKGMLGDYYLDGKGVKKDMRKGIQLIKEDAANNSRMAKTLLAYCYATGCGVPKDIEKGFNDLNEICEEIWKERLDVDRTCSIRSNAIGLLFHLALPSWTSPFSSCSFGSRSISKNDIFTMASLASCPGYGDELAQLYCGMACEHSGNKADAEQFLIVAADGYKYTDAAVETLKGIGSLETATKHEKLNITKQDLIDMGVVIEEKESPKPKAIASTSQKVETPSKKENKKETTEESPVNEIVKGFKRLFSSFFE